MNRNNYIQIAKSLEALFGAGIEVVLHDLKERRIAYITEASRTRKAGDLSEFSKSEVFSPGVLGPYQKEGEGGETQKSVSTVLCDPEGTPDYMLCINFSTGNLLLAKSLIEGFIGISGSAPLTDYFQENWQDKINHFIGDYIKKCNISMGQLTRDDKKTLVLELKASGAFKGKNAAQYIADSLKISRASVYGYTKLREDDHET